MKILFFGDIFGKIGRKALKKELPELKKKYQPDLILANGENLAHGTGLTEKTILEMQTAGIDFFTTGNHVYDNEQGAEYLKNNKQAPVVVPANLDEQGPGKIYEILEINNHKILIINLLGQVFIKNKTLCPFKTIDKILTEIANSSSLPARARIKTIIIDFHAEASSEKQAFWHYVNGRASAVLGTHTHVPTALPRISQDGTAFVEDVGMVGGITDSVIGDKKEAVIKRFLTKEKHHLEPAETGATMINSVLLNINDKTGKAEKIERIDLILDK